MADLSTLTLPVLPLRNGVVFPHMVVTVMIESDEARRAIAAAESSDGRLLLVPRLEGEYASVGTIADIQEITQDNGNGALSFPVFPALVLARERPVETTSCGSRPSGSLTMRRPMSPMFADSRPSTERSSRRYSSCAA